MTTVKSSFSLNRVWPVYKNLLRRNRGTALFYGALGLLFLGLQYIFSLVEYNNGIQAQHSMPRFNMVGPAGVYNGFAVVFFTMMSLIVPIIVATNLFGYMQSKRSVDVYHALPLTRDELYVATSAAGITLIWVPMILNFAFVTVCAVFAPQRNFTMIALELLCWLAVSFVLFAITAFAAVNVGTTFDTSIFSLGLNASIALPYLVVIAISSAFLYGFQQTDEFMMFAYRLSPITLMVVRQGLGNNDQDYLLDNNIAILIWFFVGIAIFIGGMLVYKKRKSEQAETVGNLGPLQMFLRAVGTLVGGTGMGALFCAVLNTEQSKPIYLAATAVGSLIVYFIGDVILTRTVRSIPKALPAAGATTAIICVIVSCIMYGGLGFETRIPSAQSVSYVTLHNYSSRYSNEPILDRDHNRSYVIKDPEAIQLIVSTHQTQIDTHFNGEEKELSYGNTGWIRMTYTLKDGRTMARSYNDLYPTASDTLIALECSRELIQQTHTAFSATADMLDSVVVSNTLGTTSTTLTLDLTQKQQLLEAVRQDLLAQPLDELKNGTQALGYLQMTYKYNSDTRTWTEAVVTREDYMVEAREVGKEFAVATSEVMITESYKNTLAMLNSLGVRGQLENDFSQIDKAYISIAGLKYFYNSAFLRQTSLEQSIYLYDNIFNSYYHDSNYQGSDAERPYVIIDNAQLRGIQSRLTNVHVYDAKNPHVVVAFTKETDGDTTITGYYFMPYKELPEDLKAAVIASAKPQYDEQDLKNMGYIL